MVDLVRSQLGESARKHVPLAAILELTRRCNLECRHCYAVPEKGRLELSRDQICGVVDELRELGTLFITFLGGDPTVNRDFLPILRHASDRKLCVQFFSNGLLIDERTADELARLRVFHVGISLYGATAATHDHVTRRPGSWHRTLRAARLIHERGIYVCFKFTALNLNIHEANEAAAMARAMDIPINFSATVTARDNLERDTVRLQPDRARHRKLLKDFFIDMISKAQIDPQGRDLGCGMGRSLVSINAYGDVFPCVTLPIPAGNVRHCSLREIWRDSPFLKEVRRFPRMDKMHGCPECHLRPYCNRCPGNTFMETGDLYGPSPTACREAILNKELDDERRGVQEEIPLPPGLDESHLPGWTAGEIVEMSGAGCESCNSMAGVRQMVDAIPVQFGGMSRYTPRG